jgi:hypothetical protein
MACLGQTDKARQFATGHLNTNAGEEANQSAAGQEIRPPMSLGPQRQLRTIVRAPRSGTCPLHLRRNMAVGSKSALGQKQTLVKVRLMSALPPKADIDRACRDVRFVPKADMPPRFETAPTRQY